MKTRMLIITVDTLLEIIKDYLGEDNVPRDAMVSKLLVKPSEQGRFAIEVVSESMKEGLAPLNVHFDMRRIYSVGG